MPPKLLAVFYHIWCPAGTDMWRLLVDEQVKRLQRSGLPCNADVFCCITGPQHAAIREFIAGHDWISVLHATADEGNYEGETLSRLHDACLARPDLKGVAYIHTKGISHFQNSTPGTFRAVNSWRHFLEWGTMDRWRDAVMALQTVDAVGVNYRNSPWPHFSGNFWWAHPRYLRTLAAPLHRPLQTPADVAVDPQTRQRISYEQWLGTNNPTVLSFYDFPFHIPGKDWTFGFDLYRDDIFPLYERNGM